MIAKSIELYYLDPQKPTPVKTIGSNLFYRRSSNDKRKEREQQHNLENHDVLYSRRKRNRDSPELDSSDYSERKRRSSRSDIHRERSREKYDRDKESPKCHKDRFGRDRNISPSENHRSHRKLSDKTENYDKTPQKLYKSGDYDAIPRRSFEKSTGVEDNQRKWYDTKKGCYVKLADLDADQRRRYEQTAEFTNSQKRSAEKSADLVSKQRENYNSANISNCSVEFIDQNPTERPSYGDNEKSKSYSSSRHSQESEYNKGYNYDDNCSETASQYSSQYTHSHHSRESQERKSSYRDKWQQQDKQTTWNQNEDSSQNRRQSLGGFD